MSARPDFDRINVAALARYPGLLETWLPGGRLDGIEYVCRVRPEDRDPSFKVNVRSGAWADFGSEAKGGDPVSLFASLRNLSQGDAARELAESLEIDPGGNGTRPPDRPAKAYPWTPIMPVPADAPAPNFEHPRHGFPAATWEYQDQDGRTLCHVVRFDPEGRRKEILPLTFCRGPEGKTEWRWKSFPEPRPLYGLDRLAKTPDAPVLLAEGEKTADAADRFLGPKVVCLTWPGGSKAVGKADFTPLKDRRVCLWPDADKPGFEAVPEVARRVGEAGAASVEIVPPPANASEGWDLADAEAEGWDRARVAAYIKEHKTTPEQFREVARERYGIEGEAHKVEDVAEAQEGPIVPVEFDQAEAPAFDPAWFPPVLSEFCGAVAEGLQVPFELVAINALSCVAVAGQRKFRVQVRLDYSEPLNIYALAALPPGERKSAAAEACKRPLVEWEEQAQIEARDRIRNTASERKTLEKIIEAKRSRAASAATAEDRKKVIEEIKALEAELPEVPASPRLLLDDVTPEALPAFMERQEQRAGIVEAEGGLFDTLAGRYSLGIPNLDAVLKFWSGEAVHVDRRNAPPILLLDPALTICLSPQPEVLRSLAGKPGFRGRGLLARFLYVLPRSRVGSREVEPQSIPQAIQARYAAKLRSLLALAWALDPNGKPTAYRLALAPDAYTLWLDFARMVEAELRSSGELELLPDWGNKMSGAAIRLAGLLHLVEHDAPHGQAVGAGTMRQALDLAAVLSEHAKVAFALMGADPDIECAKHILAWIRRDRVERFQAREALRAVRGRYPKMEFVNPGLSILAERGFIFPEGILERETGRAGRKPSPRYTVNPLAFGGAS